MYPCIVRQLLNQLEAAEARVAECERGEACLLCHCCIDAPVRHGEILEQWVERALAAEARVKELEEWKATAEIELRMHAIKPGSGCADCYNQGWEHAEAQYEGKLIIDTSEAHVVELDTAGSPDRDGIPYSEVLSVTRSSSTGPDVQYALVEDTRDQTLADLRALVDEAMEWLNANVPHAKDCQIRRAGACSCGLWELCARLEARG
jgi:hypothetical protein